MRQAYAPITSGVPQGSVLGPLLFLLYINDVVDLFSGVVNVKLYADDIKIYLEIADDTDIDQLQMGIDRLSVWADTWQLTLAVDKTMHLRVGLCKSSPKAVYYLNGSSLRTVDEVRDLGILVDAHMSFKCHINVTVAKAHVRANQIIRCFLSRDPETLVRAFVTYVRPLVEYCSPVWSPYTIGLIKRVESVQKVFTKKLPGMRYLSYEERLSVLNLESLEVRRLKFDLVTCFKILKGLTSITPTEFFTLSGGSTRGHSLKLYCPDSRINIRAHFFAVRVIHVWNRLPPHMVAVDDVKSFARGLDSLSSKFFSTRY